MVSGPYNPPNGIDGSGVSCPDQIRWVSIASGPVNGKERLFAFVLSTRQGVALRNRLLAGPVRPCPGSLGVRFAPRHRALAGDGRGIHPGNRPGAGQDIVLTGHMQEGPVEANDDASGTASMLEIGRALSG